jgi:hypothetical protein
MAITGQALGINIAINTVITTVCFIAFSIMRSVGITKYFYTPRIHSSKVITKPEPPGKSWTWTICKYKLHELIKTSGLDTGIYVLLLRYNMLLFFLLSIWCCSVLIPVNLSGGYITEVNTSQNSTFSDLDKLYLSNIPSGSNKLWAHLVSVYVVTFVILTIFWKLASEVAQLRIKYPNTSRTVMVTDIPADSNVSNEMSVYGECEVTPVKFQTKNLLEYHNEYENCKAQLDSINNNAMACKEKNKTFKNQTMYMFGAKYGQWGKDKYGVKPVTIDKRTFLIERCQYLQDKIRNCDIKNSQSAFVSYNKTVHSKFATECLHGENDMTWQIKEAPSSPDEILWLNLQKSKMERRFRNIGSWVILFAIMVVYIPLCAAIQSLIEFNKLKDTPAIGVIVNLPFVSSLLQGILPGLVLAIFINFIPPIINLCSRLGGTILTSEIDYKLITRFFIFQFFTVFIATVVGGSFLDQITLIASDPSVIWQILGISLPTTATFFMSYIMIAGLSGAALMMLRIVGLLIYVLRHKLAFTQKARSALWEDQSMTFGYFIANHAIITMLGLIFCCQSPIITLFVLLYYMVNWSLDKYKVIYIFNIEYNGHGKLWSYTFPLMMTGVYIFQLMMIISLSLKRFVFAPIIIPLPIITAIFHITCNKVFNRAWTKTSIQACIKSESKEHHSEPKYISKVFTTNTHEDDYHDIISDMNAVFTEA